MFMNSACATDEQQRITAEAKKQVKAMTGFYGHLAIYALVIETLTVIYAVTGDRWWAQWSPMGWGIGLLGYAISVFGKTPAFPSNWQVRKVHELANKN